MRTTGKFDINGLEIFEGDKVLKSWGFGPNTGTIYQVHTITVNPAHMMANGKMHDDGGGIIFCLGKAYNFWEGKEVKKLIEQDVADLDIPEDKNFFIKDGKAIIYTDQHLMGLNDEEWQKEIKRREEILNKIIWSKNN